MQIFINHIGIERKKFLKIAIINQTTSCYSFKLCKTKTIKTEHPHAHILLKEVSNTLAYKKKKKRKRKWNIIESNTNVFIDIKT